ncbi:Pm3-like protein [Hordeum vulgare]|nr:Pm3-like protein [Hordeum vulgare]
MEDALDTPSTEHVETASPTTFIFIDRSSMIPAILLPCETKLFHLHLHRWRAAAVPSYKNDGDDEVDSFENVPSEKKEFMYKEDNHSEDSLEPIIDLTQIWEAVPKEKHEAEELKRIVLKKFESPYALDKPSTRFARGTRPSGTTSASREVVADELTPELIEAAVTFVEIACRYEKNKGKSVYYNGSLNVLTSEMLRPILEHRWVSDVVIDYYHAHLALRVGHDYHLCPAWRSRYLVHRALVRDNPLPSPYNIDSELSRFGAVNRVKDEYTLCDKTYVALNVGNTHWITVVMHMRKKEFQVMDSLYPLEQSVDRVKALRLAIANDFLEVNRTTPGKYVHVSNWPIKEYPMPQQEDM